MKKVLILTLSVVVVALSLISFVGCVQENPDISITGPDISDEGVGIVSFTFNQTQIESRGWPSKEEWQSFMGYWVSKSDSLSIKIEEVLSRNSQVWDTTLVLPVKNGVVEGNISLEKGYYTIKKAFLFTRKYPYNGYYWESFFSPEEKNFTVANGNQTVDIFLTNNKIFPANVSVHDYDGDEKQINKQYGLWIVSLNSWISSANTTTSPNGLVKYHGYCREKIRGNCSKEVTFDFVAEFKEEAFYDLYHFKIWDACKHHEVSLWVGENVATNDTVDIFYFKNETNFNLVFDHDLIPEIISMSPAPGISTADVKIVTATFNKPVADFKNIVFLVGDIIPTSITQIGRKISFNTSALPAKEYIVSLTGTDKYIQPWIKKTWTITVQ